MTKIFQRREWSVGLILVLDLNKNYVLPKLIPNTYSILNNSLEATRLYCYTKFGKYNGLYLKENVLYFLLRKNNDQMDPISTRINMIETKN